MMREADVDGDGQISFDEFRIIMTVNDFSNSQDSNYQ